jgi:hypothetical protein
LVVALLLATATSLAAGPRLARAQDSATPDPSSGITVEMLGQESSAVAPDLVLLLNRRTLAPGADSGAHPAPGPVVLSVESGTVVFELKEGAALVTREGKTATEIVKSGSEVTLNKGDVVSDDEGVVHDVYSVGSAPALTSEARLNPSSSATAAKPNR